MGADKRIFLINAPADNVLADLFRSSLILGGAPEEAIYRSSEQKSCASSTEPITRHIQRLLGDTGLAIALISPTFLAQPVCLMELGGAGALGIPTYPIAIAPLTRDQLVRQVGNMRIGELGNRSQIGDVFDEFHTHLAQNFDIQPDATAWERAIAEFKRQLPLKLHAARTTAALATTSAPAKLGSTPSISTPARADIAPPVARSDCGKITVGNVSVVAGTTGKRIYGEVTNHDGAQHSAAITATFYNAEGLIIGTADAVVSQIGPRQTKTFDMRRIPDYARAKVDIGLVI